MHIIVYDGSHIPKGIGTQFQKISSTLGIRPADTVVLSHARGVARQACGLPGVDGGDGSSNLCRLAQAVGLFWQPFGSRHGREQALVVVERMILDLMGKIEDDEPPRRAAERTGIDRRWLRRSALQMILSLPCACEDAEDARQEWIEKARSAFRRVLPYRDSITENQYLKQPRSSWSRELTSDPRRELKCATIHEVKGLQYGGVCVVIPPDHGQGARTAQLFSAWRERADAEEKRVIYVGVTRAERLLALAIPSKFRQECIWILNEAMVPYVLDHLPAEDVGVSPNQLSLAV